MMKKQLKRLNLFARIIVKEKLKFKINNLLPIFCNQNPPNIIMKIILVRFLKPIWRKLMQCSNIWKSLHLSTDLTLFYLSTSFCLQKTIKSIVLFNIVTSSVLLTVSHLSFSVLSGTIPKETDSKH